jgi:hypothetical protein
MINQVRLGAAISIGAFLLCCTSACVAAYRDAPPVTIDLSGYWRLNTTVSDDPEQMLQQRLAEERKEQEKWLRRQRERDPLGIPPIDAAERPAPNRSQLQSRMRRLEEMRRMLDISDTLSIRQQGMRIQISSKVDTNTYDAGSKSQVSMPQGELADQSVGWDGPWFVVRRRASRGPQMIYKYRLLKNDQLETQLNWSGDSPLAGMKVHRIYDRTLEPPPPPDPDRGPVR